MTPLPSERVPGRVGMASIDREHERLIELLGRLEAALAAGEPRATASQLLSQALHFLKFHAEGEEQLLGIVNYPKLAEHRAEHARLIQLLGALDAEQLTAERLAAVWTSFIRHVEAADRAYVAWLANPTARAT